MQSYLSLYDGALPTYEIYQKYEKLAKQNNLGAICVFTGIVRSEKSSEEGKEKCNVSGLYFEIYEPILKSWFDAWQSKANKIGVTLLMSHSKGEVAQGQSSYMAGVISSKRRAALSLYDEFIEDFKHNAPIWKFDIIDGERIYAKSKSHEISGSGILA